MQISDMRCPHCGRSLLHAPAQAAQQAATAPEPPARASAAPDPLATAVEAVMRQRPDLLGKYAEGAEPERPVPVLPTIVAEMARALEVYPEERERAHVAIYLDRATYIRLVREVTGREWDMQRRQLHGVPVYIVQRPAGIETGTHVQVLTSPV